MRCLWFFSVALLCGIQFARGLVAKRVQFTYPITYLDSEVADGAGAQTYASDVDEDRLVCFHNNDIHTLKIWDAVLCMLPYLPIFGRLERCLGIWGSRSIVIKVEGNVEYLQVSHFPNRNDELPTIDALRFLELTTTNQPTRKIITVPAEPLHICAKSNGHVAHWPDDSNAAANPSHRFEWSFRNAFLRDQDRQQFFRCLCVFLLLLVVTQNSYFLPYTLAFLCFCVAYTFFALQKIMVIIAMSGVVILVLSPVMFVFNYSKHMPLNRLYLKYMFRNYFHFLFGRPSEHIAEEVSEMEAFLKKKRPFIQAIYFSSFLCFFGCAAIYALYLALVLPRELRNFLLKLIISLSFAWCGFFIGRTFERFFLDWMFLFLTIAFARLIFSSHDHMTHRNLVINYSTDEEDYEFETALSNQSFKSQYFQFVINSNAKDDMLFALFGVAFVLTQIVKRSRMMRRMDVYARYVIQDVIVEYVSRNVLYWFNSRVKTLPSVNSSQLQKGNNSFTATKRTLRHHKEHSQ